MEFTNDSLFDSSPEVLRNRNTFNESFDSGVNDSITDYLDLDDVLTDINSSNIGID